MKLLLSVLVGMSLLGCFATVDRHGRVHPGVFSLLLPPLLPPLVVLEPGVSVVSDLDDEVFYADGYYYAQQDERWYRSADHRSGWAQIEVQTVPRRISGSPRGQYRRYHAAQPVQEHRRDDDRR